jgi:methionyl aminopeptidase
MSNATRNHLSTRCHDRSSHSLSLSLFPWCLRSSFAAEKERQSFRPPPFDYTGPIRPHYVTPRRFVPAHIQRPDYATNGQPEGESRKSIHLNSEKEIKGIRIACKLGRAALDHAARHVRVGISTDELDELVHNFIIANDAYPSPLNYKFFPKSCCTSVHTLKHRTHPALPFSSSFVY